MLIRSGAFVEALSHGGGSAINFASSTNVFNASDVERREVRERIQCVAFISSEHFGLTPSVVVQRVQHGLRLANQVTVYRWIYNAPLASVSVLDDLRAYWLQEAS